MMAARTALRLWWRARAARERALLAVLGGILLLLGFAYGVVQPLAHWRQDAQLRLTSAQADAVAYQAQAGMLAAARDRARRSDGAPAATARSAAQAAGLGPVEVMVQADGTLSVALERARVSAVMDWLARVERDHGIAVVRLDLQRGPTGMVDGRVELQAAGR